MPEIYRIALVGDKGAGKKSLIRAYVTGQAIDPKSTDLPAQDNKSDQILLPAPNTSDTQVKVFLDTKNYAKADLIMYVFDVNNEESFADIKTWKDEVKRHNPDAPVILVGCKSDKKDQRNVDLKTSTQDYADSEDCPYIETSSVTGENVEKLFKDAIQKINDKKESNIDHFKKRTPKEAPQKIQGDIKAASFNNAKHALDRATSIVEMKNNLDNMNQNTAKQKDNKEWRAQIRQATVEKLKKLVGDLLKNTSPQEIQKESEALKELCEELDILQGSGGLLGQRDKTAKIEIEKLHQRLTQQHEILTLKDKLDNAGNTPDPVTAMQYLAKARGLQPQEIINIIKSHLINDLNTNNAKELSTAMMQLSENERSHLKRFALLLTHNDAAGSYGVEGNTNIPEKDEWVRTLWRDCKNVNSKIPFIYILCTSKSGKTGQKTASYDDWLLGMKSRLMDNLPLGKGNSPISTGGFFSRQKKDDVTGQPVNTKVKPLKGGDNL